MYFKEVKITFRTITPLWTGDAWQESKIIRPSSLIGSLRFWFEVLMYFSGVLKKDDFNENLKRFEKEVNKESLENFIKENGNNLNEIVKHLLENQKIPISSIIFGTTNWKSLIEIKSIKELEDYCYGNKLNLPYALGINKKTQSIEEFKEEKDWRTKVESYNKGMFKENLKEAKEEYSFFFFPKPYFYGQFEVIFKVAEEILKPIFYPLLNFMDKYGYWGGKWNIGYGRLRIDKVEIKNDKNQPEWREEQFDLTIFNKEKVKINDLISSNVNDFNELLKETKIKILNNQSQQTDFKILIKELIKIKIQERKNITDQKDRHYIFGKTGKIEGEDLPQGSKILPFIEEKEGQLKGGFLSIAGLLDLY